MLVSILDAADSSVLHYDKKNSAKTPTSVPLVMVPLSSVLPPMSVMAAFKSPSDLTIYPEAVSPSLDVSLLPVVSKSVLVPEPSVLKMKTSLHPASTVPLPAAHTVMSESLPVSTPQGFDFF